jgi:DNA-binding NarL/FixJ family response regulator
MRRYNVIHRAVGSAKARDEATLQRVPSDSGGLMPQKMLGVLTYVVASNQLAGEYLRHVLAGRFTRTILCRELPNPRLKSDLAIFVVETSAIPLPLGRCLHRLRDLFPKARILVVSEPQPIDELLQLLRLGVHGFVDHAKVSESLCDAAESVAKGHLWVPQELLQTYVESTVKDPGSRLTGRRIPTPREAEVLELAKQRFSNKEIAKVLRIEEGTVKYHLSKIMSKLHVKDRRELLNRAPVARIWEQLDVPTSN